MRGRGVNAAKRSSRVTGSKQRCVVPSRHGVLRGHEDRAVRPQLEPLLGDGRAQEIAAELLESIPILAPDGDGAMQVEAVTPRL